MKLAPAFEKSTYVNLIKMKVFMPITSAPIERNRHMSISHRRDNPFIVAVIARHRCPLTNVPLMNKGCTK